MSALETQPASEIYVQARPLRWRGRLLLAITLLALAGLGFKI